MKTLVNIFCLSLLLAASVSFADTPIQVKKTISFSAESNAPQKVQHECNLQTQVPSYLSAYAKKAVTFVDGDFATEGKQLKLEISSAFAPGGGAWSGAKYVEVTGELIENGKVIGSFIGSRYSTGGMFGGFKGTCSITARCAKAIAKDISIWLKNPTIDARLGNSN